MRATDTVAVYFVQAMTHGFGYDSHRLRSIFAEAGVDPELMRHPSARIPAKAYATLWLMLNRELCDEFFGLDSHGMPPGSFALICRALIQEPNLHKALRQCLSNFSLFLHDFRGTLTVFDARAVIRLESNAKDSTFQRFGEEAFLGLITSLLCWLAGRRIKIDRADFRQLRAPLSEDAVLWGANITFGALQTEIEFSSHYLQLPVIQNFASLKIFLRTAPQWLVIRFRNYDSLASTAYQLMRNSDYSKWPTLKKFALDLNLSQSTVRRKLESEGLSYQEIKNDVRRALAIDLLANSKLTTIEIAELCGFQESSAFHRAFKKWTNNSPGRFRQKSKMQ